MTLRSVSDEDEWDPRFGDFYAEALSATGLSSAQVRAQVRYAEHFLRCATGYLSEGDQTRLDSGQIFFAAGSISPLFPPMTYELEDLLSPGRFSSASPLNESIAEVLISRAHTTRGIAINNQMPNTGEWLSAGIIGAKFMGYFVLERLFVRMLGLWHKSMNRFNQALACYLRALSMAEDERNKKVTAVIQNDIGVLYLAMGQPGEALPHLRKAHTTFQGESDFRALASLANNLIVALIDLKYFEEGLEIAEANMRIPCGVVDAVSQGETLQNIALIHKALGHQDLALSALHQAQDLFESTGQSNAFANALSIKSSIFWDLGDTAQARRLQEQALEIYRASNNIPFIVAALHNLSLLKEGEQELESAISLLDQAIRLAEVYRLTVDGSHTPISELQAQLSTWLKDLCTDLIWELLAVDLPVDKLTFIADHPRLLEEGAQQILAGLCEEAENDADLFEDLAVHVELLKLTREYGLAVLRDNLSGTGGSD